MSHELCFSMGYAMQSMQFLYVVLDHSVQFRFNHQESQESFV